MTIKYKSIKKTCNLNRNPPLHGSFAGIDWADGPFFLKTDIDPIGGNDYSITSVQQLLSVPYALYAKDAGNGFSGDYNDLVNVPQIPQIPADISAFNNDAHYVTNTNNNCADSLDFCALLSLMAQLQQQLDDIQNQLNQIPTVQTIDVYGIRYHECESGGIVVDDGGAAITSLGLCWSTEPNPTIDDNHSTLDLYYFDPFSGEFYDSIIGLLAGTTYYVRAYATNNVGTSYGENKMFTTTITDSLINPYGRWTAVSRYAYNNRL